MYSVIDGNLTRKVCMDPLEELACILIASSFVHLLVKLKPFLPVQAQAPRLAHEWRHLHRSLPIPELRESRTVGPG